MKNRTLTPSFKPCAKATFFALLLSTPALAQNADITAGPPAEVIKAQYVQDTGGSQRIDASGKLRMLSQRIPAAACNLNAGISVSESKEVLNGAVAEFARILAALENGDDDMGIYGAEERLRTLRTIEEVHKKFAPIEAALADAPNGIPSDAAIQVLADESIAVLEIAKRLVLELKGQYSTGASLLQSDAMLIDIAGRQRMLTQKISREICQIMSDVNASASREVLHGTIEIFEASLYALETGMPSVGILPPPTEEIAEGLKSVNSDWLAIKAHIDEIDAGQTLSDEQRAIVFVGLNKTMADMNRVVGLYADASEQNL